MAARLNKGSFIGRVGKDAELRNVGETSVCQFSLAVSPFKKDGATLWVRCSIWGDRGGKLEPYLKKGLLVYVDGELNVRAYAGKDGPAASLEMRVNELSMLEFQDSGEREEPRRTRGKAKADDGDDFPDF